MITDDGDIAEITRWVRELYGRVPLLIRPMIPPLPQIFQQIPRCAMKYTLGELVDLMLDADARGLL